MSRVAAHGQGERQQPGRDDRGGEARESFVNTQVGEDTGGFAQSTTVAFVTAVQGSAMILLLSSGRICYRSLQPSRTPYTPVQVHVYLATDDHTVVDDLPKTDFDHRLAFLAYGSLAMMG